MNTEPINKNNLQMIEQESFLQAAKRVKKAYFLLIYYKKQRQNNPIKMTSKKSKSNKNSSQQKQIYSSSHKKLSSDHNFYQSATLMSSIHKTKSQRSLQNFNFVPHEDKKCKEGARKFLEQKNNIVANGNSASKEEKKSAKQLKVLCGDQYHIVKAKEKKKKQKKDHHARENPLKLSQASVLFGSTCENNPPSVLQPRYNPDNYNWRKSVSRSKERSIIVQSPKQIKPIKVKQSQYYPFTKQSIIRQDDYELASSRKKSKSLSNGHNRSTSALSKPKVVKHVFEEKTSRSKKEIPTTSQSLKSLLFTFGI